MKQKISLKRYRESRRVLVGGVNSPVRSFRAVGGHPLFFERAKGAYLYDADSNRFLDYCQSWGALILGHAHPDVIRRISQQAAKGTSFGACTALETQLGLLIRQFLPSCEKIRFTNSGTEAVMTAVRIARAAARKNRIVKFEGCYHGHLDALLVKSGSGLAARKKPSSAGIPHRVIRDTLVLPFNDSRALKKAFQKHRDIGAVIVEPIAGNMGLIPAHPSFLCELRALTRKNNALLIFDEVITGFRSSLDGAQGLYGIQPDLTTLGKVIGGGLPIGAVGGPRMLMRILAPEGPVYQAGTLSGNPLSTSAGIATLRLLSQDDFFKKLVRQSGEFILKLREAFTACGIPVAVPWVGTLFSIFFMKKAPRAFHEIEPSHQKIYARFFHHMLRHGIYLPPSPFEVLFISSALSESDFKKTLDAVRKFRKWTP